MDKFTTEIIQTLAQNGNIGEVFHSHLEKAVNTLLAQELTAFLDYEKYDPIALALTLATHEMVYTNARCTWSMAT